MIDKLNVRTIESQLVRIGRGLVFLNSLNCAHIIIIRGIILHDIFIILY